MVEVCGIETELEMLEKEMNNEIQFNSLKLEDLVDLPMNNLDRHFLPALVFSVSSITGKISNKITSLASVFQYVFLAHHIHKLVTDEDMSENARQYPVLTGDFMFGQTLKKIFEEDLCCYAGQFVKVIESMNEGIIMRWRFKNKNISMKDYQVILKKERASLTALSGKLAAEASGLPQPYISKFENFGYYVGMAWAASEEPSCTVLLQEYITGAEMMLEELKDYLPTKPLRELLRFFSAEMNLNFGR